MTDEDVVEDEPPQDEEVIPPTTEELLAEAIVRAEKAEAEIGYRDADIINLRRRHIADRNEAAKFAGFNLAARILPVLDNLDRALDGAEEGPLKEGIQLTRENLMQALTTEGVTAIDVGETFDPNLMEAMTTLPATNECPDGTVIDTIEVGYMYKERVLRPARVVVSKE
ncbi:MAG: nucleotide exchange factor GrpE [Candidatus Thalassarchaeaceae archaeon]|jgi:molecular chaperone GrpE (heat shock protein)|nr:nucleotide exchange factor GrpE [Candidatus Thalassarchaeaceae archaeon]